MDLVADAQTLQEENLSQKGSVESARRLFHDNLLSPSFSSIIKILNSVEQQSQRNDYLLHQDFHDITNNHFIF